MALVGSLLTSGTDTGNVASYATASVTPTSNALILLGIRVSGTNPAPLISTVSGNGITYTQVGKNADGASTCYIFRGMAASPSAGAITITTAASETACSWYVFQFTGAETSGVNGANAVTNFSEGRPAASLTPSLAWTGATTASNGAFGLLTTNAAMTGATPGTGWTTTVFVSQVTPAAALLAEYTNLSPPAAINGTFSGGTASVSALVGVEVIPAAGGGGTVTKQAPVPPNRARFRAAFW